jgi:hypothetical protein
MFSRIADGRQRQSISAGLYVYGLMSYAGRCVVGLNQRAGNTSVFQYFCMWAWENAFSIAVLIPQYFSIDTSVLQY